MTVQTTHIQTTKRTEFVDITKSIQDQVTKSSIQEGICIVYCPHTTAAITINENADPDVKSDMIKKLNQLIPKEDLHIAYQHGEGNSDSHIKSSLFGCEKTIIIKNGQLNLGTWQGIYFCEFDGPRARTVTIKIIQG